MAKTKKESTLEKAEKAVEHIVDKAGETLRKAAEAVEHEVDHLMGDDKKEKKAKTHKKHEEKDEKEIKHAPKHDDDDKKAKIEALKKKLGEKAKELEKKVSGDEKTSLKEKVTGEKEEKKDMLVPIEDYLKASIHLGTRVITPDMRKYVYRRRADGLAVFNTSLLDDKMREAIDYLAKFDTKDFIVVCKREAGWKPVEIFAQTLGVKVFTKKYPAGVLTNTNLETFFETNMILICDPWLDKNAVQDANKIKVKVMSVCDTNNFTAGIDFVLPGNNKSWKSLGMIFYLLTKGYIEKRKLDIPIPSIDKFVEGWDSLQPPL